MTPVCPSAGCVLCVLLRGHTGGETMLSAMGGLILDVAYGELVNLTLQG